MNNLPDAASLVIIGVGNRVRGDDGAGPAVAGLLRGKEMPGVRIVEEERDGLSILEHWREGESVILVDAVVSGAPPGTIHRLNLLDDKLPAWSNRHSTHLIGIADAVGIARALSRLPSELRFIGIEGSAFGIGERMTDVVQQAVEGVAGAILHELAIRA